jgi:YD repeat-containing protein
MNAIIGIRNAVRKAVSGIIVAIRGYGDEYDADGHIIHSKGADGFEQWYEYDTNGTLIHMNDSEGFEWKCSRKEITK